MTFSLHAFSPLSWVIRAGHCLDATLLCNADITQLWDQRENAYKTYVFQHEHIPGEGETLVKFGAPKKNWVTSLNCSRCNGSARTVSPARIGASSFHWLEGDHGWCVQGGWSHLIGVQAPLNRQFFSMLTGLLVDHGSGNSACGVPWRLVVLSRMIMKLGIDRSNLRRDLNSDQQQ